MFRRGDAPTGHDYWNFAAAEDFCARYRGDRDAEAAYGVSLWSARRCRGVTCRRKLSGAAFIHDMVRPDMLHARILRQPCRGAHLASLDEAALRRAERGEFRVVRVGDFVAFVGADETVVQRAAAVAPMHAKWDNVRQITPAQQEAEWLIGQPSNDRVLGDPLPAAETADVVDGELFPALYRACLDGDRPVRWRSIATAICRCGRTRRASIRCAPRWRTCWASRQDTITVRHAHGAGAMGTMARTMSRWMPR